MQAASYDQAIHQPTQFIGVAENAPPPYGGKPRKKEDDDAEDIYAEVLQLLEAKYLEDRFSVCIEIRDGDRVVYAFPKLACPELFIERLKIDTRKL